MTVLPRPVVIGIAGRIGAGKTTVGRYLAESHGFQYVRYSQVLADWLPQDPQCKNRLQGVGWDVMAGGLQPELNQRLIARIDRNRDCAVDGLRHPIDFTSLSQVFASAFFLMYIDCPPGIRWEHVKPTGRYSSQEEFLAADAHAVEQQTEELRANAYVRLLNSGSLKELKSGVEDALEGIRSGEQP